MTTTRLAVVAQEQCVLTYNFFVCSKVAPAYLIIMHFREASFSLMSIAEPSFDYLYFYEKSRIRTMIKGDQQPVTISAYIFSHK